MTSTDINMHAHGAINDDGLVARIRPIEGDTDTDGRGHSLAPSPYAGEGAIGSPGAQFATPTGYGSTGQRCDSADTSSLNSPGGHATGGLFRAEIEFNSGKILRHERLNESELGLCEELRIEGVIKGYSFAPACLPPNPASMSPDPAWERYVPTWEAVMVIMLIALGASVFGGW